MLKITYFYYLENIGRIVAVINVVILVNCCSGRIIETYLPHNSVKKRVVGSSQCKPRILGIMRIPLSLFEMIYILD